MGTKKILLPVDFSTCSNDALPRAAALARDQGATLLIMHVQEPPMAYGGGGMYYGAVDPDLESLQAMLEEIVPDDPEIPVEYRMEMGEPADAIVRVAQEEEVDIIVMGTHGRTGLKHLLLGSIAEAIVRRAPCPVMTVKHPPEKGKGKQK